MVVVVVMVVLLMCRSTSANMQETVAVLTAHFPHIRSDHVELYARRFWALLQLRSCEAPRLCLGKGPKGTESQVLRSLAEFLCGPYRSSGASAHDSEGGSDAVAQFCKHGWRKSASLRRLQVLATSRKSNHEGSDDWLSISVLQSSAGSRLAVPQALMNTN